jgi:hypothetical protein
MSSYLALAKTSEALRRILWEAISTDPIVSQHVSTESAIVFANPTDAAADSSNRLSVWLYQVTENEFLKNQPQVRGNGHDTTQRTPLAINLFYLITPFAGSAEADLLLLGKAMQVFYDNAILAVRQPGDDVVEELRIIFCRLSLEELTLVWQALKEAYRLSVCYQVRVTRIDSSKVDAATRVIEHSGTFTGAPAPEGGS